jgi:hypothetical protein
MFESPSLGTILSQLYLVHTHYYNTVMDYQWVLQNARWIYSTLRGPCPLSLSLSCPPPPPPSGQAVVVRSSLIGCLALTQSSPSSPLVQPRFYMSSWFPYLKPILCAWLTHYPDDGGGKYL